ncbi:MAG: PQQ-binding-like beta-propeller repeat protein, partial [Gemmataceae bacterium]|nr:PQQ-binding-like beta-propeller repeat protein [Gemmataceae bacterium]
MNRTAAFFLLVVGMASGIAQDSPKPGTLLGEERRVRDEIETADRLAAEGRIEDALRRYQQTLAESGDVFVSLAPQDPRRALPARWLIHSRIAALPAEARRLYRRSVEERVKPWLEQGRSQRDPALLEQIVTEAFCSESAEPALLLLGDLALERGEFELAEHYWLMLADYPAARSAEGTAEPRTRLRHPDVQGSEAVVQARLILSLLLRGEKAAAKSQWEAFRTKHPEAQGDLAGRSGRLADTLGGLLDSDLAFRQAGGGGIWPTFGGDSTRGRVIPAGTVPYWPDVPTWRSSIPGEQAVRAHRETDPPLGVASMARSLAFHPVIIPGYALIADAARIFVYRLNDGRLVGSYDHRLTAGLPLSLDLRVPTRSDLAYTLTVSGDRIYARFGAQTMAPPDAGAAGVESESVIACLEWRRTGDDRVRMIPRWQLRARTLDSDPPALFEGAPIVRDGRMYLARTRFEGRQAVTSIECYDADSLDQREPPIRRWRQEIWSVEMGSDRPRQRHDLLTMAGTNVVFCTHSGAIIALDALTGRRAWAFRYGTSPPRSTDGLLPRDLAPCLYAAGRVYAVPADADRIFCLDARSGELIWDSGPTYAIHLLGVSNGRLFATLGGFPQGLRAYDAAKGTVLWTKPDEGDRATFGRGLVSDQFVFWPTRMGLRVLHQEDGEPADARSSAEPWGNLAFADGYVIVTTPTEIWGFVPPRAQLGRRQSEAEQNPDDALRQYELAIAQADAGDRAAALQSLANAAQSAQDHDDRFGQPLKKLISLRRRELLESDWKNAAVSVASTAGDVLAQARDAELDAVDRIRLWILRRALGDRSFPEILETPEIHRLWLTKEDGSPIRADAYLIGLLDGEARAVWDRRAEQQWQGERSRPLTQAVERLSFSPAVRKALLEEARRREAHEADSAAVAYRSVLAGTLRAPPDAESARERVAAIEGLLRVYEA